MPHEAIIYFGDTARVPYGTKSAQTVQKYALQNARFLYEKGVKMIVVACNTVSSVALDVLPAIVDIPVIGVIDPGARAAVKLTRNKRVGVIGTTATVKAGKYGQAINALDPDIEVYAKACPLFVPLVEEGWIDSAVTEEIARIYLSELSDRQIDSLILGCTHYPLIKAVIRRVVSDHINIIDTAIETARDVKRILRAKGLIRTGHSPRRRFYVSDFPQKFEEIAARFLGKPLEDVTRVALDDPCP